jgi:hypothetical protein
VTRILGVVAAVGVLAAVVWCVGEKLGWWHVPVGRHLDRARDHVAGHVERVTDKYVPDMRKD